MKNGGLTLDDRDPRILTILQKEGRITKMELAERHGTARRIRQRTEA